MSDLVADIIGGELLGALRAELAEGRDHLLPEDKEVLERTFRRLAGLVALKVRLPNPGEPPPEGQVDMAEDIDREIAVVEAILANYRAVAVLVLSHTAGRSLEAVSKILGQIARGLLAGALGVRGL